MPDNRNRRAMDLVIEESGVIAYRHAYARQLQLVEQLRVDPEASDHCLVLEHPAVFTLGRNGTAAHVTVSEAFLQQRGIEVVRIERGGEVTYHGPGQLVCYPIVNLRRCGLSVVGFVELLEEVMIRTAAKHGLKAVRNCRNRGVWVGERKLGSVGIAVRHGITYHGLALNGMVDLEPFQWINPCGMTGVLMTSMHREKVSVDLQDLRHTLIEELGSVFRRRLRQVDTVQLAPQRILAKPHWLKKPLPSGPGYERTRRLLRGRNIHTVCREARCPNQFECFGKGTATFMIMGDTCTRNCRFCAVGHGGVGPLDPDEPRRVADAAIDLGLDHVVVTSVTRDDLQDGGVGHFIETMRAIRAGRADISIELLIPDLQGDVVALGRLCGERPEVLNHNVETVPRLYQSVRPQADYQRSLDLLRTVKRIAPDIVTKSGLMLGLGERGDELYQTLEDIRGAGCDLLTLGQYLQPTRNHVPVARFVEPAEFEQLRQAALELGFRGVASGPHVRSSFQAGQLYRFMR